MTEKNTGGPAFPVAAEWGVGEAPFVQEGMTLRDWFAGKALTGIMERPALDDNDHMDIPTIVNAAYRIADAMIKEREK